MLRGFGRFIDDEGRRFNVTPIPKTLRFDGKGEYTDFERKFKKYIDFEDLNSETALFCLETCLRGYASDYLQYLRKNEEVNDLHDVFLRLKKKFGIKQSLQSSMLRFQNDHQRIDDTGDDTLQSDLKTNRLENLESNQFRLSHRLDKQTGIRREMKIDTKDITLLISGKKPDILNSQRLQPPRPNLNYQESSSTRDNEADKLKKRLE